MATLTANIDAALRLIGVTDGPTTVTPGTRFRIGDEVVQFEGFHVRTHRTPWMTDTARWRVIRGVQGSIKASHLSGVEVEYASDAFVSDESAVPSPFSASPGGGGGGALSIIHEQVDGQDAYGFLDENEQPRYFDGEVMVPD